MIPQQPVDDGTARGLDPIYTAALRQVLVQEVARSTAAHGFSAGVRRWWRGLSRRTVIGVSAVFALAAAGTAAYAVGVVLPGGTQSTPLGVPVTVVRSGSATIDLGPRPAGVTSAVVEVSCLSAGRIDWPDGSSWVCSAAGVAKPESLKSPGSTVLPLQEGQHTLTFTAAPDVTWRVTATYAASSETAWGVNDNGETYGVANSHGEPDLIAVAATNGRQGYAYSATLATADGPPPKSFEEALARQKTNHGKTITVPVYESDGKTQIGVFTIVN